MVRLLRTIEGLCRRSSLVGEYVICFLGPCMSLCSWGAKALKTLTISTKRCLSHELRSTAMEVLIIFFYMAIVFVSKTGKVTKCASNVSGLLLRKQEIKIDRCYIPVF